MKLLEVRGLEKSFTDRKRVFRAVKGIDLTLSEGECLGIAGESGCGKSTIANMVARLLKEDKGEIFFEGRKINEGKKLTCVGRRLQMVFQSPKDSFDPRYSVLRSVMMGADSYHIYAKEDLEKRAREMIEYVGLKASYADKPVGRLSGGECQRAAIARALLCEPKMIIFDEATSALDVSIQAQILQLMKRLKEERGVAFLFITHDLAAASTICDRLAVMYAGRIVETGRTKEILKKPAHPYTRQLLSAVLPLKTDGSYELLLVQKYREPCEAGCDYYASCPKAEDACRENVLEYETCGQRQVLCRRGI